MMNYFRALLLFFLPLLSVAQTTIGDKNKPELADKPGVLAPGKKHKIMIIPFEKKMYMSQIDHKINAETKWDQKKIRAAFREGIDNELSKKLKTKFDVISLLSDTIKYKKDIFSVYEHLSYKFDKVPNQEHYTAPKTEKEKQNIKKGQLVVESTTGEHFMNAKILSPALIPGLYAKYKTDIYLFINQIDITSNNAGGVDLANANSRTITIHYTVYTVDAKEINSGTCSVKFPADVNNPSKITSAYLSKIAAEIAARIEKAAYPKAKA